MSEYDEGFRDGVIFSSKLYMHSIRNLNNFNEICIMASDQILATRKFEITNKKLNYLVIIKQHEYKINLNENLQEKNNEQ